MDNGIITNSFIPKKIRIRLKEGNQSGNYYLSTTETEVNNISLILFSVFILIISNTFVILQPDIFIHQSLTQMKKLYFIAFFLFIAATSGFAQSNLWGMTSSGGAEFGTIFKTDADGSNLTTETEFMPGNPGMNPFYSKLCVASNGKYY